MVAGSLFCGKAMYSVLPWPQGFFDDHDRIDHNTNRVVMRRKDPFLVNFSSLVCFHQHFQFMIQRILQLAIF